MPELILKGELFAGAELNLGIASAGAEGVIGLVTNFDLYDPNSDGKVRIDELVGNFLYEWNYGNPALAPVAIFDVYGEIYAQLRAFVEALFFKIDFDITPPITLFEFSIPFERAPILATERGDGSLLLNIGQNSAQRLNGDTRDIGEKIYVESLSDTEVLVWGMGLIESSGQKYQIKAGQSIFAYGGDGNDLIDLSLVTHNIQYVIEGGAGDDTVLGGQSGGRSTAAPATTPDTGGEGVDLIVGGEGSDTIDGKGADDVIFGDSGSVSNVDGGSSASGPCRREGRRRPHPRRRRQRHHLRRRRQRLDRGRRRRRHRARRRRQLRLPRRPAARLTGATTSTRAGWVRRTRSLAMPATTRCSAARATTSSTAAPTTTRSRAATAST